MEPYVFLVGFIFFFAIISQFCFPGSKAKQGAVFLILSFVYIYIFCSIRGFEVGRDVPGYIKMYEKTASVAWNNWDYVYFENGYIALMKICNMLKFTAREFFFVIYLIILFPVFLLIKNRSPYPLLSLTVYICFQFFVFDLTGLRQAIGLSICMLAYLVATRTRDKHNLLLFVLLVLGASMFHKSALIFLCAYPVLKLPLNRKMIILYCISVAICYLLNIAGVGAILSYFEKDHYEYSTDSSQQIGFFAIALCMITVLAIWTYFHTDRSKQLQVKYAANMLLASMCLLFLFNGSVLLRSVMYYYFSMIISIPMFVSCLGDRKLRLMVSAGIIFVFVLFFFTNEVYTFDVSPYVIGEDLTPTR